MLRAHLLLAFLPFLAVVVPARAQEPDSAARRLAGREEWRTDFSRHSVPFEEIVSGGPPKDGIPSIDRPRFESAREAGRWLDDRDPVMVVENGDVAKAGRGLGSAVRGTAHGTGRERRGQGNPAGRALEPRRGERPRRRGDRARRDVGQTAVYDRRVGTRVLTFHPVQGGFRDRETGSGWTLAGRAVDGPLQGQRLKPIPHGNHFWFAWAVFRPRTEVWRP